MAIRHSAALPVGPGMCCQSCSQLLWTSSAIKTLMSLPTTIAALRGADRLTAHAVQGVCYSSGRPGRYNRSAEGSGPVKPEGTCHSASTAPGSACSTPAGLPAMSRLPPSADSNLQGTYCIGHLHISPNPRPLCRPDTSKTWQRTSRTAGFQMRSLPHWMMLSCTTA